MACNGTNARMAPLIDGTVKPENIELEFRTVNNLYYDNLHFDQLDLSEMSISETFIARERRQKLGGGKWDWSGIPGFLARGHGWVGIYANEASGIKTLADLNGKRVGIPDFEMTYALWFRIVLKDLYGIDASDITWFNMRQRGDSHGLELGLDDDPPVGVKLHFLKPDQDPVAMLASGELDAAPVPGPKAAETPQLKRLLPDRGKEVISQFFQKTGFHQPNHHFIVQNRVLKEHPWVATAFFEALQRSKAVAYERAGAEAKADEGTGLGPELFGADPYPLGIRAMRPTLERAIRGLSEQGLLKEPATIEDVYHPSLLDT